MMTAKRVSMASVLILSLLFGIVSVVGVAQAKGKVTHMKLAAGRVTHPQYALVAGVADAVSKQSDWLRLDLVTTPGMTGNIEMVMANPKDYIGLSGVEGLLLISQSKRYEYYDKVRLIGIIGLVCSSFVTYDKDIKTLADLAGKRVNVHRKASSYWAMCKQIMEEAGVWDNIRQANVGFGGGMKELRDGTVDVACSTFDFIYPNTYRKGAAIIQAETRAPIYYIDFNKEAMEKIYKRKTSTGIPLRVPAGALDPKTQPESFSANIIVSYLIADEQMDDDIVYEVARIMHKNAGTYEKWHPQGANMTKEFIPSYLLSKDWVHRGALKFYEDNNIPVKDMFQLLQ